MRHRQAGQRHVPVLGAGQGVAGPDDLHRVVHLGGQLAALRLVQVVQALGRGGDVHVQGLAGRTALAQFHLAEHVAGEVLDVLGRVDAIQRTADQRRRACRAAGGGMDDARRRAGVAGHLRRRQGLAASLLCREAARGAGAAELRADARQQGFGLLARQALELEDLVHHVLDVLGDVAQGRRRVARRHHRQAADGGADEVLHRVLQAGDQGFELPGVEQAGEVVDQPIAEGEGTARGGDVEVVQQRDRPGRQGRVAGGQAAAQRLSEAVEAGGVEVVVGERRQGILEQVGQRRGHPGQKHPGHHHQRHISFAHKAPPNARGAGRAPACRPPRRAARPTRWTRPRTAAARVR